MAEWSIGMDGGGTHTRAVLVDGDGNVRGVRMGGCGNYQRIGVAGLRELLDQLLPPLLELASPHAIPLCLALAGAGRLDEQERIACDVRDRGWAGPVRVESDARAALEGAHAGAPGLIAIAGTGSIVLGKNEGDELVRAGGWGPLLGDEGSGYYLGLQALRAAISHLDGTGPDTALVGTLAAELELESWDRLVPGVYGGSIDRARIAALGPLVCQIARQDDAVALDIVDRAGTALGAQVGAVARRLGLAAEVELSCMGGVFQTQGLIEPALERAAAAHIGRLYLRPALLPGVLGAVLLAWRQVGWSVGESQLLNLRESRLEGL